MCLFIIRIPKILVQICCLRYIYALKLFLSSVARVTWIETWKTGPIFSSFNSALAKIINKLLWLVLPGKFVLYLQNSTGALGSSSKDDGNEDGKKAIGLDWLAKEKLCTCITLFYTFLFCRCMTTMWNCLILRSLQASSPIWASETSLARTRERAAKPRVSRGSLRLHK